jgi:hypothetical protein
MVTELVASKEFNWKPFIIESDDKSAFVPSYDVSTEARSTPITFISRFADLPTSGMWRDRRESDIALLYKLGGNWSGFGGEQ